MIGILLYKFGNNKSSMATLKNIIYNKIPQNLEKNNLIIFLVSQKLIILLEN